MTEKILDINKKSGFICDMDGVIYHGNILLPGVSEFVDWLKKEDKHFLFLTNSSERSPKELQQKLARMGLDVDEKHFYTSALATGRLFGKSKAGLLGLCHRRTGSYQRFIRKGHFHERCQSRLCGGRRNAQLQL